jgi:hypothetical protein
MKRAWLLSLQGTERQLLSIVEVSRGAQVWRPATKGNVSISHACLPIGSRGTWTK